MSAVLPLPAITQSPCYGFVEATGTGRGVQAHVWIAKAAQVVTVWVAVEGCQPVSLGCQPVSLAGWGGLGDVLMRISYEVHRNRRGAQEERAQRRHVTGICKYVCWDGGGLRQLGCS